MVAMTVYSPENIDAAIAQAGASHHRLVLVVGPSEAGKTPFLRRLHSEKGWPLIALGQDLSRRLLPLTVKQRELKTADVIADMIQETHADRVLVDNTDIVFDSNLRLNVSGLLTALSRNTLLVWAWQGVLDSGAAIHGTKGHPEYRALPTTDLTVIEMTATGE
jgi:hypothetical protein